MRRCAVMLCLLLSLSAAQGADRPNVIVILADDLGYSDLGCYGSRIQTPHLDQLAADGLRFTQFYNTARCWPTRAALLTGYYAQQVRRDALPGLKGGGGNRNGRPEWAPLLPAMLKTAGYRSYHSGKWHIDGMPIKSGFDRSYMMRDHSRFFNPQTHFRDDKKLPPVEKGTDFYTSDAIVNHAIECLQEHQQEYQEQPFFHFVAFTAPHFPLHAPAEDIARYKDRYLRDWETVREERAAKQQEMGLLSVPLSAVEQNLGPPYHFPDQLEILGSGEVNRPLPWSSLTEEQRRFQADKMAIHAAMIDRMDQQIGRIIEQVRSMQAFDDTLILFLSDNGASAEIMVRGDGHDPEVAPGSAETYLCLGPGWSTTCNTPFRRHKTWVHEGGISTPLIAHWPKGIKGRNEFRQAVGHVIDIVPTILQIAGAEPLTEVNGKTVPIAPGTSLVPAFDSADASLHETLWWMHEGHRAVRQGDWKLVAAKGDLWELYNVLEDRAEQHDLAESKPELVNELAAAWETTADGIRELYPSE
jgi:arylsulfatase A-like enzyme